MPQAVTHILVPLVIVSLFKDWYDSRPKNKKKKIKFSLHYVLIAGLGGVLPDIDIPISFILNFLGIASWNIHKTFTHSLLLPILFFILFLIFTRTNTEARICNIGRHNLKLSIIFLMLAVGSILHLGLDTISGNQSVLLYPLSLTDYGISLIKLFTPELQPWIIPTLDGILLVIWLIYLELKHKISDFV